MLLVLSLFTRLRCVPPLLTHSQFVLSPHPYPANSLANTPTILPTLPLGGSTNAVLHLIAMARAVDVPLTIDDFQVCFCSMQVHFGQPLTSHYACQAIYKQYITTYSPTQFVLHGVLGPVQPLPEFMELHTRAK